MEHESFGGTDAPILFCEVWVGAGMAREDGKILVSGRSLHGAANVSLLEKGGDALESVCGRLSRNLIAVGAGKGLADPLEEPRTDCRIANAADFPPEDKREVAKVVSTQFSAGLGEAVRVGGATSRPRNRGTLDKTSLGESFETLPNRRSRHPHGLGQLADFEGLPLPKEVHNNRVAQAGVMGLLVVYRRSHTFTVPLVMFLTSIYAKNLWIGGFA